MFQKQHANFVCSLEHNKPFYSSYRPTAVPCDSGIKMAMRTVIVVVLQLSKKTLNNSFFLSTSRTTGKIKSKTVDRRLCEKSYDLHVIGNPTNTPVQRAVYTSA